jgi:hypothetical protein
VTTWRRRRARVATGGRRRQRSRLHRRLGGLEWATHPFLSESGSPDRALAAHVLRRA